MFPVLQRGGGKCEIPVRAAGSTVLTNVVDVQVLEMSELDEILMRQIHFAIIIKTTRRLQRARSSANDFVV